MHKNGSLPLVDSVLPRGVIAQGIGTQAFALGAVAVKKSRIPSAEIEDY